MNDLSLFHELLAPSVSAIEAVVAHLEQTIIDDAPVEVRKGGLIKEGVHEELDTLRAQAQGGKEWLETFAQNTKEQTGISSLKVKFNKVFGYYIEVSKANLHLVPDTFIRKQNPGKCRALYYPGAQRV